MPELPEVETTRRGLQPHVEGRRVLNVVLRRADLRWPIPAAIERVLPGQRIGAIERRAKYLLLHTQAGSALIHLGMSGALRVLAPGVPVGSHDHYDLLLDTGRVLRYTDPRRFGCLLWQAPGTLHPLLAELGPEPLAADFDGDYLWRRAHDRSAPIKTFLMDQRIVVGVGNIYAAEALFTAGIHPLRAAGRVSRARCAALADAVKRILEHAIARGGTTLRDFISPDGLPGYFEQELTVYGRAGLPCKRCGHTVNMITLGQRSSFYCPHCQR
ncbi:bifunctional DNA-formamidopyrimidine glycosylase/DNA-(apurinic or apyrimidinic site) lyase [Metallibacterium scheffleri]|uniref:Formamidopyrimidine-DNA glycosylase n=1 Tax=Metallibacterium scheffleri TaxID=993689 RepID=A0A4S3KRB3_9GAMM|nr:bifunctional DNA-formamidopyrimidine glycosylase/DNA-(apurinic or apyrimidinic site) lyase [Metallibacterium scheffleri]THD11520.1 DNA-formamidopyrimidine glycosylase [Metallibacterium scheffleri]